MTNYTASCAYIKVKNSGSKAISNDLKKAEKFPKYLHRMVQVLDGTSKKVSNTPV